MKKKNAVLWYRKAIVVVALFAIAFMVGCSLPKLAGLTGTSNAEKEQKIAKGEPVNILILGIDARPGETKTRSDTMMLASVDPEAQKVALVSIPRDTKAKVPGALDKINNANAIGGPKAACKAVEELMDVDVDYYVLTNFRGFAKMIDILDGVTVDVEKRMYYPAEGINLRAGVQHLNGKDALAYVRFRGDALGDIARTQRQQKFIKALSEEMLKTKTILKLPSLIPQLKANIETDMSTKAMIDLAKLALKFSSDDLVTQTLPGYFYDDPNNGASYWIVDKAKAKNLIPKLIAGQKISVIQESPYPVVKKDRGKIPSNQTPITSEPDNNDEIPVEQPSEPPVTLPDEPEVPGDSTTPPPQGPDQPSNLGPEGYAVST